GGMGVVYAAYDPEIDRKVALKLVRSSLTGVNEVRARLLREAQALGRLSHPNIVAIYDVGMFGEQLFIAMELVAGQNLRQWVIEARPSVAALVSTFVELGKGLAVVHRQGLIHRDLKPENLLIGQDGRPRITDFGLAASVAQPIRETPTVSEEALPPPHSLVTQTGKQRGTPSYMAPEQKAGRVDARSDQFSFCLCLAEALNQLMGPLKSQKRAPAWLQRILSRGLAEDPAERYPSMDELVRALARESE